MAMMRKKEGPPFLVLYFMASIVATMIEYSWLSSWKVPTVSAFSSNKKPVWRKTGYPVGQRWDVVSLKQSGSSDDLECLLRRQALEYQEGMALAEEFRLERQQREERKRSRQQQQQEQKQRDSKKSTSAGLFLKNPFGKPPSSGVKSVYSIPTSSFLQQAQNQRTLSNSARTSQVAGTASGSGDNLLLLMTMSAATSQYSQALFLTIIAIIACVSFWSSSLTEEFFAQPVSSPTTTTTTITTTTAPNPRPSSPLVYSAMSSSDMFSLTGWKSKGMTSLLEIS